MASGRQMQAGPDRRTRHEDRRGSVAVEAALVLSLVLLPLLLAVWDLAEILATRARTDAAVQAAILATWSGADPADAAIAAYGAAAPPLTVAPPQTGCVCTTPAGTRQNGTVTPC